MNYKPFTLSLRKKLNQFFTEFFGEHYKESHVINSFLFIPLQGVASDTEKAEQLSDSISTHLSTDRFDIFLGNIIMDEGGCFRYDLVVFDMESSLSFIASISKESESVLESDGIDDFIFTLDEDESTYWIQASLDIEDSYNQ